MTLLMRDQENLERGIEQGKEEGRREGRKEGQKAGRMEGEDKMLALIQKLMADNRFDDIEKMKEDRVYRQKLFNEYRM